MKRISIVAMILMGFAVIFSGCRREVPPQPDPLPEKPQVDEMQKLVTHLKERLDRLEVQQSTLVKKVDGFEARPVVVATSEGEDVEQIIEKAVAQKLANVSDQKVSEIALNEIKAYEQRKEEERQAAIEQRRQEREARQQEREQERVTEMTEELGLDPQQAEELLIARAGLRNTMREVFDYMREQGSFDRDLARQTITELQTEHEKILSEFMTDGQVKVYLDRYGFNPRRFAGRGRRD